MARTRRRNAKGQFVRGGTRQNPPKRRRRRAHHVTRRVTRRRRSVTFSINKPRRRHRRRSYASNPPRRKRHYRRNPGISVRGIVGSVVQGAKDGTAVVAGQVVARKIRGAVTGMLPATAQAQVSTGLGQIGLAIASAVATTIAARSFVPNGYKRLVAAGAFSEAIQAALAQTPIASYLSAFPTRRVFPRSGYNVPAGRTAGIAAYPLPRARLAAYPMPRVPMMYTSGT